MSVNKKAKALTISYRQIAAIPIKARIAAGPDLAAVMAASLTPGQRASLFPSYYKDSSTQVASLGNAPLSRTPPAGTSSPNQGGGYNGSSTPSGGHSSVTDAITKVIPTFNPDSSSSTVSGAPSYTSPNDKINSIINSLMAGDPEHGLKGLPYEKARLLAANFGSETTTFNTSDVGDKELGLNSTGLGQWNRVRLENLQKFAKNRSEDMYDIKTQSLFSLWEFNNTHKKSYTDFMAATNDADAYQILRKEYERGAVGGANATHFAEALAQIDTGNVARGAGGTAFPVDPLLAFMDKTQPTETATALSGKITGADAIFVSPVTGKFADNSSNVYGASRDGGGREHSGTDWHAQNGTMSVFPVSGTIIQGAKDKSDESGGYYGNTVIKGDDGRIYRLAYHGDPAQTFKVGQRVSQGDPAGIIDKGHLHFEIIEKEIDGKPNPKYAEFVHNLEVNDGKLAYEVPRVSTSNQNGTSDPAKVLGLTPGDSVKQGEATGNLAKTQIAQLQSTATPVSVNPDSLKTTVLQDNPNGTQPVNTAKNEAYSKLNITNNAGGAESYLPDYGKGTHVALGIPDSPDFPERPVAYMPGAYANDTNLGTNALQAQDFGAALLPVPSDQLFMNNSRDNYTQGPGSLQDPNTSALLSPKTVVPGNTALPSEVARITPKIQPPATLSPAPSAVSGQQANILTSEINPAITNTVAMTRTKTFGGPPTILSA